MSAQTDWKQKLAAYLHDPPSKALDIATHTERSAAAFRQAGFTDEEINQYLKAADHMAAAADRLPFPASVASGLQCAFDGLRNSFHHPLTGSSMPFHAEFKSTEQAFDGEGSVQPVINYFGNRTLPDQQWQARFFAHWRLWPSHAAQKDYRLAFLPADTRIPDHTIWTHMQVVSALAGCTEGGGRPAFFKFQIGPIQDFIAASRSIRDLWSGSYLLSWLMAAGLKALSAEVGPDSVVYPSLRGQPLFDLHWRKDLWNEVKIGGKPVWESFGYGKKADDSRLLTPNLPNVFLAIVPADRAVELGQKVKQAICSEWENIAKSVWEYSEGAGLTADETAVTSAQRKARFDTQVSKFLSISWQATPWPDTLEEALKMAAQFADGMPAKSAHARVQTVIDMATRWMPKDHRDGRYYTDKEKKDALNNIGLGWAVILAVNGWQLDAVRQTRSFEAWNTGGWDSGTICNKDVLNGRDEAVAGGREWCKRCASLGGQWKSLFKKEDWVGAGTLIKRLWHTSYLTKEPWCLKTTPLNFPMPNTRGIASHKPFEDCGDDETVDDIPASEKYFAVLALDGDEIGKWVSGEKTPAFKSQLADYKDGSGNASGAMEYFTRDSAPDAGGKLKNRYAAFLDARRPLSPSYHLQFSETLTNFALLCARPIVEVFDGRLVYAGGDDVVALLPADTVLACAQALRAAFRGDTELAQLLKNAATNVPASKRLYYQQMAERESLLAAPHQGFVTNGDGYADYSGRLIPFAVPGSAADCSVGIAIAHFKSPLQDVVRAAQAAEKRAKNKLNRAAVAVTLMKRSGEILEWGCKWESGGLELCNALFNALENKELSSKAPHRLVELLEPYLSQPTPLLEKSKKHQDADGFAQAADGIIRQEFESVLARQKGEKYPGVEQMRTQFGSLLQVYLGNLTPQNNSKLQDKLNSLIGLCQVVAFGYRTSAKEPTNSAERQNA